jgi:DNA polymerase-3 subunit gamma/tau
MSIVNALVLQSRNLESALDELAEAIHRIALIQAAPEFRDPVRGDWDSLVQRASQISPEDAQLYYQIAITGRRDMGLAPDPRTGLEMTLLRMLAFKPVDTGSGGSVAAKKPAVTGPGDTRPIQTAPAVQNKPASGGNKAARAARAAFEELQKSTSGSAPKKAHLPEPEPELKQEQRPQIEAGGELELGSQLGFEASSTRPSGDNDPSADWSSLQNNLELNGATREFARNIQLESVAKDRWTFLVPDTLQILGSESVIQSLQTALSNRLGHAVKLDLHKASDPVKSVAAAQQRAENNRMSEAERAIDEDSTVQDIKNKFGAKIVPDSIQPLQ